MVLYQSGNIQEAGKYLNEMVHDRNFCLQLGRQAQKIQRDKFDRNRMRRETIELYRTVLARGVVCIRVAELGNESY